MSLWRQLRSGIADLWDRSARDGDTADEVAHFRAQLVAEGIARGLTPQEAQRTAALELGGETQLREHARSYGWERHVAGWIGDLRYAWRGLRNDRAFSGVSVGTMAIGIGAATAIFSAVRPVLFDGLPYPDGDRVRAVVEWSADGRRSPGSFAMYHALADGTRSFAHMSVHAPWSPSLTGDGRPERLSGQRVSTAYFRVLGVAPAIGRDLTAADDQPDSPPVVLISDGLWKRRFAADPGIVGRQVQLDDAAVTVIGVMPAGFEHVTAPDVELWTPLAYGLGQGRAWGHHLTTLGRLRPDVDPVAAEAELNALGARVIAEQQPPTYGTDVRWAVPSLHEDLTRDVRPALVAVLIAVGVVLLLACVNVTNLLLVRGARRREEFALRAALGASRARLVRQVLTESLLLSSVGGLLGVAAASVGVGAIAAASPAGLPRVQAIVVDRPLLLVALALTTVVGVLVGLVPALQASGQDRLAIDLGTARVTGGRRRVLRSGLVAAQVALALVLLTASGLLVRSMQRLFAVAPGFDARAVVTMQLKASPLRYAAAGATQLYFDQVLDAVRRVPGVEEAAFTSQLPMSGDHEAYGVTLERPAVAAPTDEREIFRYAVTPGYLELMRIPLRAGRTLEAGDRAGAPPSVVVNESFVRRYLHDRDPIGQRLWIGATDGPPFTVVGVVGDVKQLSLAGGVPDAVYTTTAQWRFEQTVLSLAVRSTRDAEQLVPALRDAVWSVDAEQPLARVATMEALMADTTVERRFVQQLFVCFAAAALLLTIAGIYGMMAGLVAERRRELGLRAAIGASPLRLVTLVLAFGAKVTAIGLAVGAVGAVAGTRLLRSLLFGVSHLDLITYAGGIVVLAVVASLACAAPAWRAARTDPARALQA